MEEFRRKLLYNHSKGEKKHLEKGNGEGVGSIGRSDTKMGPYVQRFNKRVLDHDA